MTAKASALPHDFIEHVSTRIVNEINGIDSKDLKAHIELGKKEFKGRELKGATLGVVGMGAIGAQVAGMGVFLDMEVICLLYTSPSPRD